jgi:hypothetical protein
VLVLVGLFLLLGCLSLLLGQNLFFTAAVRLGLLAPPPVRQFAGEFAAVWRSAPGLGDWILEQLGIDF